LLNILYASTLVIDFVGLLFLNDKLLILLIFGSSSLAVSFFLLEYLVIVFALFC